MKIDVKLFPFSATIHPEDMDVVEPKEPSHDHRAQPDVATPGQAPVTSRELVKLWITDVPQEDLLLSEVFKHVRMAIGGNKIVNVEVWTPRKNGLMRTRISLHVVSRDYASFDQIIMRPTTG